MSSIFQFEQAHGNVDAESAKWIASIIGRHVTMRHDWFNIPAGTRFWAKSHVWRNGEGHFICTLEPQGWVEIEIPDVMLSLPGDDDYDA